MNNYPINSTINSTTVVELADASSLNVYMYLLYKINNTLCYEYKYLQVPH